MNEERARVDLSEPTIKQHNPLLDVNIESKILPLRTLKVEFIGSDGAVVERGNYRSRREMNAALRLVLPDGRRYTVTDRFWQTFCAHHGLSFNVFSYFDFSETFDRVSKVRKEANVRVCMETFRREGDHVGHGVMLTCTNPARPILRTEEAIQLIEKNNGTSVTYNRGRVGASFACPFPVEFDLFGRHSEKFRSRFYMEMPLDGYGLPASYLQLLRVICTNGMVAMSKAFRTYFSLGKDDTSLLPVLDRAVEAFNNEEGFHALRERLEAAATSWCSLREYMNLVKAMSAGCQADGWGLQTRVELLAKLNTKAGHPYQMYGISTANEPSPSKMRLLPVQASLYDLINFASEVDSHQFRSLAAHTAVNAWLGNLVTGEYDLEGSKGEGGADFTQLYFEGTAAIAKAKRAELGID